MHTGSISPEDYPRLRRQLLRWYDAHQRDLPWRNTTDPYAIWVSETMLQQTQVATVIDYYHRFLAEFPTVQALALADPQAVLAQWQGLGYYRRARHMQAAAQRIMNDFGGEFPEQLESILSLPGIGRYTAGAIASFAYDMRAPILEANTARLFSRLTLLRDSPKTASSQNVLWQFAEAILPRRGGARLLNQAVMELGSLVCTPQKPKCHECPLRQLCPTHAAGLEHDIPRVELKPQVTELTHVQVVIRHRRGLLMRQHLAGEWWEGLWDFPRVDIANQQLTSCGVYDASNILEKKLDFVRHAMAATYNLDCQPSRFLQAIKHSVTRFRIRLECFEARVQPGFELDMPGRWAWVSAPVDLPLNASAQRILSTVLRDRK